MKWTIRCRMNLMTSKELTYVIEADSAEEAERLYDLKGLVTNSRYVEKDDVPLTPFVVEKIRPYLKSDDPDRYMVVVKFKKRKGDKKTVIFGADMTARKAWEQAGIVKDWLDSELEPEYLYEYISVMKQEPNMGTIFAYGD